MPHITQASDALTQVTKGPFAIGRGCRLCGHTIMRRRGRGRGAGFREGNKQRGQMHSHIRDTHPNALAATYDILADDGWQDPIPSLPIHELKKLD